MQLSEVIHYYIGQKMLYSSHHEPQNEPYILSLSNIEEAIKFGDRIILRRLESMTEKEMRELYRVKGLWAFIPDSHIKRIYFKEDNKNCIQYEFDGPGGGSGWRTGTEYMYLNQLWPTQFHYLLSEGFDLFGLIPSGQAIDNTQTLEEGKGGEV